MLDNNLAIESRDIKRIEKLNECKNLETFWSDVRKLTKNVKSDHSIGRWQILAEAREKELIKSKRNNDIMNYIDENHTLGTYSDATILMAENRINGIPKTETILEVMQSLEMEWNEENYKEIERAYYSDTVCAIICAIMRALKIADKESGALCGE